MPNPGTSKAFENFFQQEAPKQLTALREDIQRKDALEAQLFRNAQQAVSEYNRNDAADGPALQISIEGHIQPWFDRLQASGKLSVIAELLSQRSRPVIHVATVEFDYPSNAISAVQEPQHLGINADLITKAGGIDVESDDVKRWSFKAREVWSEVVNLEKTDAGLIVTVTPWPVSSSPGTGYGFKAEQLKKRYAPQDLSALTAEIPARAVIEFAKAIQNGSVEKTLLAALRTK